MLQIATWRELARTGRLGQFVLLCLGIWLHAADTLLTATLMPAAVSEIGGIAYINWTIALYQIGSILTGAAAGNLAQQFGLRGALLTAALVYSLGCVASATASDIGGMLAGRLIQGLGGGMLLALSYVAIQMLFPRRQ